MGNLNSFLYIALLAPLIMVPIIFVGRVRRVFIFLLIGITTCLLCGELNTIVLNFLDLDETYSVLNVFPVIEEIFKTIPIVVYVYTFKPKTKDLLLSSLLVGVGFAVLENAYIFTQYYKEADILLGIFRGFGAGMMHSLCCLMVGYGLTFVRKDRIFAICGTIALLALAIMYHSVYNCIVSSSYPKLAIILPTLTFIPLLIVLKKNKVQLNNDIQ